MDGEMVVVVALIALAAGAALGYFRGKGQDQSERILTLETALERARTELADYRRDVYQQFSQTAEKFRALDDSYHDLHRQLAESSQILCGDDALPLLPDSRSAPLLDVQSRDADRPSTDPPQDEQRVPTLTELEIQVELPAGDKTADDTQSSATATRV